MKPHFYKDTMKHLQALDCSVLITTGRTGSDFLQSLFDSHSQVLTFNGILDFHQFWQNSKIVQSGHIVSSDLLDEFIGCSIEKFKSKYDFLERKDCLGDDGQQSINIDLNSFKEYALALLEGVDATSCNFMLSIYGAYALCLGQDLTQKKMLLHHIHHAQRLPAYFRDFPNSKIICMTRDPRANFVSGVIHWRKYDKNRDHEAHLYHYIKRIIVDSNSVEQYPNECMVVKIEDLGKECILQTLCDWLDIQYENILEHSTWAGLRWRGDRLSKNANTQTGWSASMLENGWEIKLSSLDKYILNFLMNDRLIHYGYPYNKIRLHDFLFIPFVILLPLLFELRYFSIKYITQAMKNHNYKHLLNNVIFYPIRVSYFYKVYVQKLAGFKFSKNYIRCD